MKRIINSLSLIIMVVLITGCEDNREGIFRYHFADRDEAIDCYLSNDEYFDNMSPNDIQYKTQNVNGTLEELKEFGASQMMDFTDEEKEAIRNALKDMNSDVKQNGYRLPDIGKITFIKSTQEEECESGAYTHGKQIFIGDYITDFLCSEDPDAVTEGENILWHEIFHCITRDNPDFRKDMYSIIHFSVQDQEYVIPPEVFDMYISNPDVEHHNSYASFNIGGENIDCFTVLITEEPFRQKGDSFFYTMDTALVPIDQSGVYYLPDDAANFWEIFGENTDYVVDPEECMADNFAFAMTYGADGYDYNSPKIIEKILEYLGKPGK